MLPGYGFGSPSSDSGTDARRGHDTGRWGVGKLPEHLPREHVHRRSGPRRHGVGKCVHADPRTRTHVCVHGARCLRAGHADGWAGRRLLGAPGTRGVEAPLETRRCICFTARAAGTSNVPELFAGRQLCVAAVACLRSPRARAPCPSAEGQPAGARHSACHSQPQTLLCLLPLPLPPSLCPPPPAAKYQRQREDLKASGGKRALTRRGVVTLRTQRPRHGHRGAAAAYGARKGPLHAQKSAGNRHVRMLQCTGAGRKVHGSALFSILCCALEIFHN